MPKATSRTSSGSIEVKIDASGLAPREFQDVHAALAWTAEQLGPLSSALGRHAAAPPLEHEVVIAASNVAHSLGQFVRGLATSSRVPNARVRLTRENAPDARDTAAETGWLALGTIVSEGHVPDRVAKDLRSALPERDELRRKAVRNAKAAA